MADTLLGYINYRDAAILVHAYVSGTITNDSLYVL